MADPMNGRKYGTTGGLLELLADNARRNPKWRAKGGNSNVLVVADGRAVSRSKRCGCSSSEDGYSGCIVGVPLHGSVDGADSCWCNIAIGVTLRLCNSRSDQINFMANITFSLPLAASEMLH